MSGHKTYSYLSILFVCLPVLMGIKVRAQDQAPRMVGEVIIVGNSTIPDATIRQYVNLYPGQILSHDDVRATEKQLIESGLFLVDPDGQVKASVTILDDGNPANQFKDILITIEEKPWEERIWRNVTPILLCVIGALALLGTTLLLMRRWCGTEAE